MKKQNDWLAILKFQPNTTLEQLATAGITTENTGLQSKEEYKENPKVVEAFSKDGQFNEKAFNDFYDQSLILYNNFANAEQEGKLIKELDYDPWDWRRSGNKRNVYAVYTSESNPMMNGYSIKGIGLINDSGFSIREIAQTNKVFDTESNTWLDYTPNNRGLFTSLTAPTLVLATYDQDEDEEVNGQVIHHRKGDYKVDADGKPYYETLGERESADKQVLQITDTLTTDGSFWNQFDFFDSDGLRKSVAGTITKYAMRIAPTLIPVVGEIYGAVSAGFALAQSLPTLGKALDGFITGNALDDDFGKAMNSWEGWASRFKGNVSDRGMEKAWSLENLSKMVSDVSLQLMQQKAIAKIPYILAKNPYTKQNINIAKNLSYAYMSLTSAQDTYSTFKDAGASDTIAGIGMLASIGGYYTLMSRDYFKPILFGDSWMNEDSLRKITISVGNDFKKIVEKEGIESGEKAAQGLFKRLKSSFIKHITEMPTTTLEKSFSEAIEEVSEEAIMDAIKCMSLGAQALGIPVGEQNLDFKFSAEDFINRYGMSFLGGLVGGAIFEGYNKLPWIGGTHNTTNNTPEANLAEFNYHILEGRADELRRNINYAWKKGKFGSTSLSGTNLRIATDINGESKLVADASDLSMTQNDLVRQALLDQVSYMEQIINREGFRDTLNSHKTMWQKMANNLPEDMYDRAAFNSLTQGINNLVTQDLTRLSTRAVRLQGQLDKLVEELPKGQDSSANNAAFEETLKNNNTYKNIKTELDEIRKERDAIMKGERMPKYVQQATLGMDSNVLRGLFNFGNLNEYTLFRYGRTFDELNDVKQQEVKLEFDQYFNGENPHLVQGSELYWKAAEALTPILKEIAESVKGMKSQGTYTTGIERYTMALEEKAKKQERIAEIDAGESTPETTAEKVKLAKEISELETEIATLRKNPYFGLQKYTKEFVDAIVEADEETLQAYARTILEGYQEAANLNQINRDDDALHALFNALQLTRGDVDFRTSLNTFRRQVLDEFFAADPTITDDLDIFEKQGIALDGTHFLDDRFDLTPILQTYDEFVQNFGVDYKKAYEAIQRLKAQLKTAGMTDDQIQTFLYGRIEYGLNDDGSIRYLKSILPLVNGSTVETYIQQIDAQRAKLKTGSTKDLVAQFLIASGQEDKINIFDILEDEAKRLVQSHTLDDYTYSEQREEQIDYALNVLGAIKAIISGSSDGLNAFNNKVAKETLKDKAFEFAEIDPETGKILLEDVATLETKLKNLKTLNDANRGLKLRIQKEIGVNMRVKFFESIKFHSEAFKREFGEEFDIDSIISRVFPAEFDPKDLTIDNYVQNEKYFIAFETAIYDSVKALNLDPDELAQKLVNVFAPKSLYKQTATRLSEKQDEIISDYDACLYMATLCSVHSNDFNVSLTRIIEAENGSIVPIYGQEHALKQVYAMVLNHKLFNGIIKRMNETYDGTDEYIKHKKELENMCIVFGGAGTGKTVGVGYLLFKMLEGKAQFMLAAPTEAQLTNLQKSLKTDADSTKSLLINPLMDSIKSNWNDPKNVKRETIKDNVGREITSWYEQVDSAVRQTNLFNPDDRVKILLIDEIGTLNSIQLKQLSDYAKSKGIIIIGLGDYKQMSGQITYAVSDTKNETDSSSFEDCFAIRTPSLTATLRVATQGKVENYNILDSRLEEIYRQITQESLSINEANSFVAGLAPLQLQYYFENDRLAGDMITSKEDVFKSTLDLALNRGQGTITIIVDDTTKSKYINNPKYEKCTIQSIEKAQGGEFTYAFVDVSKHQSNKYDELRFLYTALQRSQVATVVLDTEGYYSGQLKITSGQSSSANNPYGGADQEAEFKRFKEWRIDALKQLSPSAEFDQHTTPSTVYTEKVVTQPKVVEEKETPTTETPKAEEPTIESAAKPVAPEVTSPSETINVEESSVSEEEPVIEEESSEEEKEEEVQLNEQKKREIKIRPVAITEQETKPSVETVKTESQDKPKHRLNATKIRNAIKSMITNDRVVVISSSDFYDHLYKTTNNDLFEAHKDIADLMELKFATQESIKSIQQFITAIRAYFLQYFNGTNFKTTLSKAIHSTAYPNMRSKSFKAFMNSNGLTGNMIIGSDHWMNLVITDEISNKTIKIPIAYNEKWSTGTYVGSFTKLNGVDYDTNGNVNKTIAQLEQEYPGIQFGKYSVILVPNNNLKDYLDEESIEWIKGRGDGRGGKSMLAINCDSVSDNWEDSVYKSDSLPSGETWAFSHREDASVVGVQTKADLNDIVKWACALIGKRFGINSESFQLISNIASSLDINTEEECNYWLSRRTKTIGWWPTQNNEDFKTYFYSEISGTDIINQDTTDKLNALIVSYLVKNNKNDQLWKLIGRIVGGKSPQTIQLKNNGTVYELSFKRNAENRYTYTLLNGQQPKTDDINITNSASTLKGILSETITDMSSNVLDGATLSIFREDSFGTQRPLSFNFIAEIIFTSAFMNTTNSDFKTILNDLNAYISNSQEFRNGIYLNIRGSEYLNNAEYYKKAEIDKNDTYCDVTDIVYPNYSIDSSKIVGDTVAEQIKNDSIELDERIQLFRYKTTGILGNTEIEEFVNQLLNDFNPNQNKNFEEFWNGFIQYVNQELLENTKKLSTLQLEWDYEKSILNTFWVDSSQQAVTNLIKDLNEVGTNPTKTIGSMQNIWLTDEGDYYHIENVDNVLTIQKVNSAPMAEEILSKIKELLRIHVDSKLLEGEPTDWGNILISNAETIQEFVKSTNDSEINSKLVSKFNVLLNGTGNAELDEIVSEVVNYLTQKLENNEC